MAAPDTPSTTPSLPAPGCSGTLPRQHLFSSLLKDNWSTSHKRAPTKEAGATQAILDHLPRPRCQQLSGYSIAKPNPAQQKRASKASEMALSLSPVWSIPWYRHTSSLITVFVHLIARQLNSPQEPVLPKPYLSRQLLRPERCVR